MHQFTAACASDARGERKREMARRTSGRRAAAIIALIAAIAALGGPSAASAASAQSVAPVYVVFDSGASWAEEASWAEG